ncbi:MAG: hypothetical protein FWH12_02375 [Treponema sp.]|nr:hypothetical protein [Treponema sp.]
MSGGLQANADILYGLYYGDIPELQFASPMAYTPINVPTNLIGIPTPKARDKKTQEAIKSIIDSQSDECPIIVQTYLLIGTAWRWCRFSQKLGRVIWEAIPDQNITDIEIDLDTNEINVVWDHVRIKYTDEYNQVKYAERKRRIGRDYIQIWWIETNNQKEIRSTTMKNPFGFIPIPFSHEPKEDEWRGHSIFGRNLRLFKSTHDIQLSRDEILAKFKPKLVQKTTNVSEWLKNNGYDDLARVDPYEDDFYVNTGEETTDFLYLNGDATSQHTAAITANNHLLVIGSGVPELFWPSLATGNHASTETQKDLGISYIHGKRRELNRAFTLLFNQSLTIKAFMEQTRYTEVQNDWDQFEMVSKEVQARIFTMFTQALGSIITNASMGYDDIQYFIDKFYPDLPDRTRNRLKENMTELMMDHTLILKGDTYGGIDEEDEPEPQDEPEGEPRAEDSTEGDGDDMDPDEKKDIGD